MEDNMGDQLLGPSDVQFSTKHQQVRDLLAESIMNGVLGVGDRMPSQMELAQHYNVSHSTIREAVALLVQEGILERIHGKGTFVRRNRPVPKTIAFILPTVYSGGIAEFTPGFDIGPRYLRAVESEAKQYGAGLLILLDNNDVEMERFNIESIIDRRADAAIIDYYGNQANLDCLQKLAAARIPFVLIDNTVEGLNIDTVATNNFGGAYRATQHMLSIDADRIYLLTNPVDNKPLRDRTGGYLSAMNDSGTAPFLCDLSRRGLASILAEVREGASSHRVGVFAQDAGTLSSFWTMLREDLDLRGRVVLGCFDEPYIEFPPDISMVKVLQPLEEIGRHGVQIVMDRLKGCREPRQLVLEPEIRLINWPDAI